MAKKVTITYISNPQVTDAFGFAFFLDGLAIPINGFLGVNVNYLRSEDEIVILMELEFCQRYPKQ